MTAEWIEVDGTLFAFPGDWALVKFDELPQFVKAAGGLGLKGCDIAAVDGDRLWIIEVKDYTYPDAKIPSDLADTVGLKAVGTMAMLYSLERQHADSGAKTFALAASRTTSIVLALHIDVPDGARGARHAAGPLIAMKQHLHRVGRTLGLSRAIITSTLVRDDRAPWTARRDPRTRSRHLQP